MNKLVSISYINNITEKIKDMSTYTQIIYQIVFGTKNSDKTLTKEMRIEVFKYASGTIKNKKCHLYQINGVEDHIHIITHIHPSVALANLVKDIKIGTSKYIKEKFPHERFIGWQTGYAAFTYSQEALPNLIKYVANQEQHHATTTSKAELIQLLQSNNLDYDEKYL